MISPPAGEPSRRRRRAQPWNSTALAPITIFSSKSAEEMEAARQKFLSKPKRTRNPQGNYGYKNRIRDIDAQEYYVHWLGLNQYPIAIYCYPQKILKNWSR